MVPLSLLVTARRHWTWLRGASERLCQFSREARLHRAKKNEGLAPHPWAVILSPTGQSLRWMRVCGGGRDYSPFPPSPFPNGRALCSRPTFQEQKSSSAAFVPLKSPRREWPCTFFVQPAILGRSCAASSRRSPKTSI